MFWQTLVATFSAVFFAELADKTQLVGITMSAKSGKPVAVILGSVSAYIVVTVVSVLIGTILGRYVKVELIRYLGASMFIIIGILMLTGRI